MKKSERLASLIGLSVEEVENAIDKGIWDILIELNRKNYFTKFSCEGHLGAHNRQNRDDYWQAYLVFCDGYKFPQYPVKYSKTNRSRSTYWWDGFGEESRQEFLENVLNWAKCLPTRVIKKTTWYTLTAKHKNQPNREEKLLAYTQDYEEIKCVLARADMDKYFDFNLRETKSQQ